MRSQVTRGRVALGVQDADIRFRFLHRAADHFGALAKGESPPAPEPFVAEIIADTIAKVVGAEVPMPLQDVGRSGPPIPGGRIQEMPEAETYLRAHGFTLVRRSTRLGISPFLSNPKAEWSNEILAERLGKAATAVGSQLTRFLKRGLVMKIGKGKDVKWKLAEMPPHV